MYFNFYGRDIESGISLPVYAIKVNLFTNINSEEYLDVLGRTILKLVKIGKVVEERELAKLLGFEGPLQKIVEFSIKDLIKDGIILLDEEKKVVKIREMNIKAKSYYALYDSFNKNILECFIPEDRFDEIKKSRNEFIKDENIYKFDEGNKPFGQVASAEIKKLVEKINKYNKNKYELDDNDKQFEEIESHIVPTDYIELERICSHNEFIKLELLIKAINNENGDLKFQWPFTNEYEATYLEKYIISYFKDNRSEYGKLKRITKMDELYSVMEISDTISGKINFYRKYNLPEERYDDIRKILSYKEIISLDSDFYKSIENPIIAFDKIIKCILKSITDNLGLCRKYKGFIVKEYLRNIDLDILLMKKVLNRRIHPANKEIYLKNIVRETSVYDYLTMIVIAPYLLQFRNNKIIEIQKELLSDNRILEFMNTIWLFRNNTGHSVEKGRYYDANYDIVLKNKDRIKEEINEAIDELNNFLEVFSRVGGCE